jgi:hypothetical protein
VASENDYAALSIVAVQIHRAARWLMHNAPGTPVPDWVDKATLTTIGQQMRIAPDDSQLAFDLERLENDNDYLRACCQDLQKQLDAERAKKNPIASEEVISQPGAAIKVTQLHLSDYGRKLLSGQCKSASPSTANPDTLTSPSSACAKSSNSPIENTPASSL